MEIVQDFQNAAHHLPKWAWWAIGGGALLAVFLGRRAATSTQPVATANAIPATAANKVSNPTGSSDIASLGEQLTTGLQYSLSTFQDDIMKQQAATQKQLDGFASTIADLQSHANVVAQTQPQPNPVNNFPAPVAPSSGSVTRTYNDGSYTTTYSSGYSTGTNSNAGSYTETVGGVDYHSNESTAYNGGGSNAPAYYDNGQPVYV